MPARRSTRRAPPRLANNPQIARWLARCRGCGLEGRIVDPVPSDLPNRSWIKDYEPVLDGLCAQCARALADR
jgi:hypothetical protein